jgi:hypothetical protein
MGSNIHAFDETTIHVRYECDVSREKRGPHCYVRLIEAPKRGSPLLDVSGYLHGRTLSLVRHGLTDRSNHLLCERLAGSHSVVRDICQDVSCTGDDITGC